jgi:glycerol-3-phosphate O-acyltransferase / dihydroxyacetone phosphate acyltransferase
MPPRYGRPVDLNTLAAEFLEAEDEPTSRIVVKNLTAVLEEEIVKLTINAPDWSVALASRALRKQRRQFHRETLHASRIARSMLWGDDENIALKDFVHVSQKFVSIALISAGLTQVFA